MVLKSNFPKNNYMAAVVEYSPVIYDTPRATILENVNQYETIISNASHYGVDIIVFPEAGLTGVHIPAERDQAKEYLVEIPSPESATRPCSDSTCDKVLQKLSCAANENKIYVAVNLLEIQYCSKDEVDCPEDCAYFYNTNIVFDREGTIIARYRKFNLFVEKAFNSTKEPELCSFKTDFGVTFGMFICFDILFNEPSVRLVKDKQVTDIVYSAAWFSELPLLTAVSTQAAWAYSMDVNLLAAGYNCPQMTGGGSGIYAGTKGPLVVIMPQKSGTKLLIAKVPKKNTDSSVLQYLFELEEEFMEKKNTKRNSLILSDDKTVTRFNDMKFLQDLSLRSFELQPLELTDDETTTNRLSYENQNFTCSIEVTWKNKYPNNSDYTNYKMIAYSGVRNFSTASVNHIEACGLILCSEDNITSCGILPDFNLKPSNIEVQSIKISAKSYNVSSIPVPSTLDSSLYPLDVSDFTFRSSIMKENDKEFYSIQMELIKPVTNLITFAVYKLPSDPSTKSATH